MAAWTLTTPRINGRWAVDGVTAVAPWRDQLRHALAGLGFTGKEVADAIEVVAQETDAAHPDLPSALRRSIQLLGRAR